MSKYTTELRYIVENEKIFPPSSDSLALTNILNNYPLEKDDFINPLLKDGMTRRQELNEKIINHFYFREIGYETVPRFLFALKRKLNEIMPLYNQMYKSVDLDINPINNVDMTETFTHTIEGSGTATNIGESVNSGSNTNELDNINVESDTPPTDLTDDDIRGNKYASRTTHDKNTSTETLGSKLNTNNSVNTTDNKTETYTRTEKGSSKGYTFAQNIEQWRNIMVNVDMQIIEELETLFMQIW